MTQVNYSNSSLYAATPQITDIVQYLDFWNPIPIISSINDELLVLPQKYTFRPDKLSNDTYGTTVYWWVFMMRNPNVIKDPIFDFVGGIEIYIPVQTSLPGLSGTIIKTGNSA